MTIAAIREKLHEYIDVADDKKVEAIYSLVENDITENIDLWEDADFLSELDTRIKDFESGNVKCSTWEEVKETAKSR